MKKLAVLIMLVAASVANAGIQVFTDAADNNDLVRKSQYDAGLASYLLLTQKGATNGVATLGADAKIPSSQLPAIAITEVETYSTHVDMTNDLANRVEGDVGIVLDTPNSGTNNNSYIVRVVGATTNWQEIVKPQSASENDPVYSANSYAVDMNQNVGSDDSPSFIGITLSGNSAVGVVTGGTWQADQIADAYLDKTGNWSGTFDGQEGTYYLGRANHTGSQLASTISDFDVEVTNNETVVANKAHTAQTDNPHSVTKTQVGLANVEDTALSTWAGSGSLGTVGTITSGTWQATSIGDSYITKSGDWTGTFDGSEGSAYLARGNHTGTQTASTISDLQSAVSNNAAVSDATTHVGQTDNPHSVTKTQVGLGNVENTALSTWAGSGNLGTVGTVTSGTWTATAIGDSYITKSGNWTGTFDGQDGSYYTNRINHSGYQDDSLIIDMGSAANASDLSVEFSTDGTTGQANNWRLYVNSSSNLAVQVHNGSSWENAAIFTRP